MPIAFVDSFHRARPVDLRGSYLLNRVSQAVLVDLRMTMFDRMLHWPTRPSKTRLRRRHLEVRQRSDQRAQSGRRGDEHAVRDSLIVIGLLLMLFYYNWQLTLLTMIVAPPIGIALRAFSRRLRRLNLENQAMLGEMTRAIQEAHEGQRVVKVYEGADYEHGRFRAINEKLRGFAMRLQVAWSAATPMPRCLVRSALHRDDGGAVAGAEHQASPGDSSLSSPLRCCCCRRCGTWRHSTARWRMAAASERVPHDRHGAEDDRTRDIGGARRGRVPRGVVPVCGCRCDALTISTSGACGEMIASSVRGARAKRPRSTEPHFIRPTAGEVCLTAPLEELTLAS
jgi:subfamily B ATP-binding cassette protein MsbA